MISFGEQLLNGVGAAGWAIGFLAALGAFLIFAGILVLTVIWIASAFDGPTKDNDNDIEEVKDK